MPSDELKQLVEVVRVRTMCASGEAAQIRHDARVTLKELAAVLKVSVAALQSWEAGRRMPQSPQSAIEYGRALDLIRKASTPGEQTLPLFDEPKRRRS